MPIPYRMKKKYTLKVVFFLLIFFSVSYAQSLINIEQHRATSVKIDSTGTINLFENPYAHSKIYKILQEWPATKISYSDSIKSAELKLQGYRAYMSYSPIANQLTSEEKISRLEEMRATFEKGFQLRPNDSQIKQLLTIVYVYLEATYRVSGQWNEMIEAATNRLVFTDPEKQVPGYISLGMGYLQLSHFEYAREAYDQAIVRLFEFYEDSLEAGNEKYLNFLYNSLRGRGSCEEKLYLHEQANRSWQHAQIIAPEEDKTGIGNRIHSVILWDDGNLKMLEKRNEGFQLFGEKKYKEARNTFLEMLPQLKSFTAKAEIEKIIAQLEFTFLGDEYQALERIQKIVNSYPQNITIADSVADSTYQSYLDAYAQMCLFQAFKVLQIGRIREAYIYFAKAASIESPSQRIAAANLVLLLTSDVRNVIHTDEVIKYGQLAWNDDKFNLNVLLKKRLAEKLAKAYKQKGDFDAATQWLVNSFSVNN